jgi:hypothetical protein
MSEITLSESYSKVSRRYVKSFVGYWGEKISSRFTAGHRLVAAGSDGVFCTVVSPRAYSWAKRKEDDDDDGTAGAVVPVG